MKLIIKATRGILTGFYVRPFAVGEADVFELNAGLAKDQTGQFGTTSTRVVKVVKLVNRHTVITIEKEIKAIKERLTDGFQHFGSMAINIQHIG